MCLDVIYPAIGGDANILKPASALIFDDTNERMYIKAITEWLYNIIQRRGFKSVYITESGISFSSYTPGYNVDGTIGGWDASNAGGVYLLQKWRDILSRYSSIISNWNVWAIGLKWYQDKNSEFTISNCNKVYNILLNF